MPDTTVGNRFSISEITFSGKVPFCLASFIFKSGFNDSNQKMRIKSALAICFMVKLLRKFDMKICDFI